MRDVKELIKVSDFANDVPTVKIMTLGGIPTAITEQHYENFYFWQNLGLENAILFRIDAHDDLEDYVKPKQIGNQKDYHKDLELHNFNCAAAYYKIIAPPSYWLNPYNDQRNRLHSLELEAEIRKVGLHDRIRWVKHYKLPTSLKEIINDIEKRGCPLILDVDLDGFSCCKRNLIGHPFNEYGYDVRIEEAYRVLSQLKKPNLITITRSQSCFGKGIETYVNPKLVDHVENRFVEQLIKLYGEKILLYQNKSTSPTI